MTPASIRAAEDRRSVTPSDSRSTACGAGIASNDTATGRQQNRRVELVVSGSSIGQAVDQGIPDQHATSVAPTSTPDQAPAQPTSPNQTTVPAGQITLKDIASKIGLEIDPVNEVMNKLIRARLVRLTETGLIIQDVTKLREFLEFLEMKEKFGDI